MRRARRLVVEKGCLAIWGLHFDPACWKAGRRMGVGHFETDRFQKARSGLILFYVANDIARSMIVVQWCCEYGKGSRPVLGIRIITDGPRSSP
jgi:hypothetical protein